MNTSDATKRRILAQRLGAEPQPVTPVVRFRAERDPSDGRLWYRVGGVGYATLKALRAAFPEARLERVKATRATQLFG